MEIVFWGVSKMGRSINVSSCIPAIARGEIRVGWLLVGENVCQERSKQGTPITHRAAENFGYPGWGFAVMIQGLETLSDR